MTRSMLLAAAGFGIAVIAAVSLTSAFRDRSLARLRRGAVIRIGYAVEAPFAFVEPDGRIAGEAPAIAREVVDRLGLGDIEWRQVAFGSLIDELQAGRIDVIAAGMFITPERAEKVAFSIPTCRVRPGLLVQTGNPKALHSYQDAVARGDVRVAALRGSVEAALLRKLGLAENRLVRVPDAAAGRAAVETGEADALALSAPTIRWMTLTRNTGRTEMAAPFVEPPAGATDGSGAAAFAFRRGDRALREAWDGVLREFVGSPAHRDLVAPLGFVATELPDRASREVLPHSR